MANKSNDNSVILARQELKELIREYSLECVFEAFVQVLASQDKEYVDRMIVELEARLRGQIQSKFN